MFCAEHGVHSGAWRNASDTVAHCKGQGDAVSCKVEVNFRGAVRCDSRRGGVSRIAGVEVEAVRVVVKRSRARGVGDADAVIGGRNGDVLPGGALSCNRMVGNICNVFFRKLCVTCSVIVIHIDILKEDIDCVLSVGIWRPNGSKFDIAISVCRKGKRCSRNGWKSAGVPIFVCPRNRPVREGVATARWVGERSERLHIDARCVRCWV